MQKTLIATALRVICSLLVTIKPTSSAACECSFTTLCESSWENLFVKELAEDAIQMLAAANSRLIVR